MDSATALLFGKSADNPQQPLAVINTYNGGRSFYLALGNPDDFNLPQIRKLLTNGILWALDKPIPKSEKTAAASDLPDAIKSAKGIDSVVEAKELKGALELQHRSLVDPDAAAVAQDDLALDQHMAHVGAALV